MSRLGIKAFQLLPQRYDALKKLQEAESERADNAEANLRHIKENFILIDRSLYEHGETVCVPVFKDFRTAPTNKSKEVE